MSLFCEVELSKLITRNLRSVKASALIKNIFFFMLQTIYLYEDGFVPCLGLYAVQLRGRKWSAEGNCKQVLKSS